MGERWLAARVNHLGRWHDAWEAWATPTLLPGSRSLQGAQLPLLGHTHCSPVHKPWRNTGYWEHSIPSGFMEEENGNQQTVTDLRSHMVIWGSRTSLSPPQTITVGVNTVLHLHLAGTHCWQPKPGVWQQPVLTGSPLLAPSKMQP